MPKKSNKPHLTQDEVKQLFYYVDGMLVWKVKPKAEMRAGDRAGCLHSSGYRHVHYKGRIYKEHRLIWLMFYGELPTFIDHITEVKDDNRIENLRAATNRQNNRNRTRDGWHGIKKPRGRNQWIAQFTIDDTSIHVGSFQDKADAALAVNFFAYLNLNDADYAFFKPNLPAKELQGFHLFQEGVAS